METTTRLLLPEVREALLNEPQELAELTEEMHPADLADLVRELEPDEAQKLLQVLPAEFTARVLEMCDEETRTRIFGEMAVDNLPEAIEITDAMAADDRADLYADLPEELRKQLLEAIPSEESQDIRQLLAYPESTAGALMTTEFVALTASLTAAQAIDEVRRVAEEMETVYSAYAINEHGTLLGVVSLRDLVVSPATRRVQELMEPNVVTIAADADAEGTAGALMTTQYVALTATLTAAQSIDEVRRVAAEMETIYSAYAVNENGTLLGVVSLRDLVVSQAARPIQELMEPNVVTIDVDADQEEAARLIAKYDLLALPVVDRSHQLLGIITVDDVIDVVQEEATEDVHRLGAVEPLELPYLATSAWELVRKRGPWLVFLFLGVMATENVLEHYAHSGLASAMMLMWFVPLIASSGGNAGSQSATLIIRAMALGRIESRDAAVIMRRELLVGVLLGLALGLLGVLRVMVTGSTRSIGMALVMACSLTAVVTVGALLGSGVPLLLRRLGIDPAVSSTPFIASVVDIAGLVVYFEIAALFLP